MGMPFFTADTRQLSFLFQLQWNVNIQYLLIGYSWDLINHSDLCFNTVIQIPVTKAASFSHTKSTL